MVSRLKILEVQEKRGSGFSTNRSRQNIFKEHLAEDYYFVGQMAAIALLQNRQASKYFSEELLNDTFVSDELASSKCVIEASSRTRYFWNSHVCRKVPNVPLLA